MSTISIMIGEIKQEADEIRQKNVKIYHRDSNHLKRGMNEQAKYYRQELESIDKIINEMESIQQRANNFLTLLKDIFKRRTTHKGKAEKNRRKQKKQKKM